LSDFLLVSAEASHDTLLLHPERALARVHARRIDPLQLENLVRIVTGATIDIAPLALSDDGERFVFPVPEALSATLAGASEPQVRGWAEQWCEVWDGVRTLDEKAEVQRSLEGLLTSLVPLANRARAGETALVLWCCL
jgi:hypothetical protein